MISKIVQEFRKKESNLISFEFLKTFKPNEVVQIYPERKGSVECTMLDTEDEDLSFRVTMKKGEMWNVHYHDCKETLLVYKGKLRDKKTGLIVTRVNPIEIKPYTPHIIEALEDSIFYVEFKAP